MGFKRVGPGCLDQPKAGSVANARMEGAAAALQLRQACLQAPAPGSKAGPAPGFPLSGTGRSAP